MDSTERCPACGHHKVLLASKGWRHAVRAVAGSRLRFCQRCGRRWLSREKIVSQPLRRRALAWSLAALAALSLVLAAWVERKVDSENRRGMAASFVLRPRVKPRPGQAPRRAPGKSAEPQSEEAEAPEEDPLGTEADGGHEVDLAPSSFAASQESGWSLARVFQDLGSAMKLVRARVAGRSEIPDRDLSDSEKKDLWERYGHMFGSKAEAKKAYEDHRKEAAAEAPAGAPEGAPAGAPAVPLP